MAKESQYTKRELDVKFQTIIEKVDEIKVDTKEQISELRKDQDDKHEQNTKILEGIDLKVSTTNGKVKRLEKWQAGLIMAGSTALFLGSVIVGLVVYIYQYQLAQQAARITSLKSMVSQLESK